MKAVIKCVKQGLLSALEGRSYKLLIFCVLATLFQFHMNFASIEGNAAKSRSMAFIVMDDTLRVNNQITYVWSVLDNDDLSSISDTTVAIVGHASKGTSSLLANFDIEYTANVGQANYDSVFVEVCGIEAGEKVCDTSLLIVYINVSPELSPDFIDLNEDDTVVVDVLENDSDLNGHRIATTEILAISNGNAMILNSDSIRFIPDADFNGDAYLVYEACDVYDLCNSDTLEIEVEPVDDAPVLQSDSVSINSGEVVNVNVAENDSDPDDDLDLESLTIIVSPASGAIASALDDGSITLNYAAVSSYSGVEIVVYELCDLEDLCARDTLYIEVVNAQSPRLVPDTMVLNEDESVIAFDVSANDSDPQGNLDASSTRIVSGPLLDGITLTINNDGTINYIPNEDVFGRDTLVYELCDLDGNCAESYVFVEIIVQPDPPIAYPDYDTLRSSGNADINVVLNDQDPDNDIDPAHILLINYVPQPGVDTSTLDDGRVIIDYKGYRPPGGIDTIQYVIFDSTGLSDTSFIYVLFEGNNPPTADIVTLLTNEDTPFLDFDVSFYVSDPDGDLDSTSTSIVSGPFVSGASASVRPSGTIDYTPAPDYFGNDTLIYEICDSTELCLTDTIVFEVAAINDRPVVRPDTFTVFTATSVCVIVGANDTDVDSELASFHIVEDPLKGTIQQHEGDTICYRANNDFTEGVDSLVYAGCDNFGLCDTAVVYLIVDDGLKDPIAINDTVSVDEDSSIYIHVMVNDFDHKGEGLEISAIAQNPVFGNAQIVGDSILYAPNEHYFGVDSLQYVICDISSSPLCDTAWVIIEVDDVPDGPEANPDTLEMDVGVIDSINVVLNDFDAEGDFDLSSLTIIVAPSSGAAASFENGFLILDFSENTDFVGLDIVVYRICDSTALCDEDTVFIQVGADQPPLTNPDTVEIEEDEGLLIIDVLDNDTDPNNDLDPSSLSIVSGFSNHQLEVSPDGTLQLTTGEDVFGADTAIYEICDLRANCSRDTVFLNVLPVPDTPVAVLDSLVMDGQGLVDSIDVSLNDYDADGDLDYASLDVVSLPGSGAVVTAATGNYFRISYLGLPDFSGTDTLIYSICDSTNRCTEGVLYIIVPVEDEFDLSPDTLVIVEDTGTVDIDVLSNDISTSSDWDISTMMITYGPVGTSNTANINGDGEIVFTPSANFYGFDTLVYTICNLNGECGSDTLFVEITSVPDTPWVQVDTLVLDAGTFDSVHVVLNDTDVEGDLNYASLSVITDPGSGASTSFNIDGWLLIDYTNIPDFFGDEFLVYELCDSTGLCDSDTVYIRVNELVELNIYTNPDTFNLSEDTGLVQLDVLRNDSSTAGDLDINSLTLISGPVNNGATASVNNGTIDFTYPENEFGTDTLIYEVCDEASNCDRDTVIIVIQSVEDAPNTALDEVIIQEDEPLLEVFVLSNDSDPENNIDTSSLSIVAGPYIPGASAGVNANGTISYTPAPDYSGNDTIIYEICDQTSLCSRDTLIITINEVNDPPIAVDDSLSVIVGDSIIIDVQQNDSDEGEMITQIIKAPTLGSAEVINNDSISYWSDNNGTEGIDTLCYVVCDNENLCDTAMVIIHVVDTIEFPLAVNDSIQLNEDNSMTITPLNNDQDPNGQLLLLSTNLLTEPLSGSAVISGDEITYTPDNNFYGRDSMQYEVCNTPGNQCDTAWILIDVIAVNDAPEILSNDTVYATIAENESYEWCLDVIEIESEAINLGVILQPENGTIDGTNDGDTCIVYNVNQDFNGQDTISVTACDIQGACDTAWLIVTITPVNEPPVVLGTGGPVDTVRADLDEDQNTTIRFNVSDENNDQVDITAILLAPVNGTISGLSDNDTSVTYTPDADFNGTDIVQLLACDDGVPVLCDTFYLALEINPVNDPPVITDGNDPIDELSVLTNFDEPVEICVTAYDIDSESIDLGATVDNPEHGAVSGSADGDTCITYTPDTGYSGEDQFSVVVCDNEGECDTLLVTVNVGEDTNLPPLADDTVRVSTNEDESISIKINASDPNNDLIDITNVTNQPRHGALSGIASGDTSITYSPDENYFGGDTMIVDLCDMQTPALCTSVVVIIDVLPVNDVLVAVDDEINLGINQDVTIRVIDNDILVDDDPVTLTLSTTPLNGIATVLPDGSVQYVPNQNFVGTDQFNYTICDSDDCDDATVTINVSGVVINNPPTTVTDTLRVNEDESGTIQVLLNDVDLDGDELVLSNLVQEPEHGTVIISGDVILYTPNPDYFGPDLLTYQVCDDGSPSLCVTEVLYIDVISVNDPPVATADVHDALVGENAIIDVLNNDFDPEGDPLTVSIILYPLRGEAIVLDDQTIQYYTTQEFTSAELIDYVVCDVHGACDTSRVIINVSEPADFFVYQGVSPNGDDKNDYLHILGIEKFPENSVQIYNRWGNLIYKKEGYNNDPEESWSGKVHFGISIGNDAPAGTYFYVVKASPGEGAEEVVKSGYLMLTRNP